jgi:hypothetical protein
MGAATVAAGIIAAVAISPLFDKVFTHPRSLGFALKVGATACAASFIGVVFAVKPANAGGLYGLFIVMGVCGFSLAPVRPPPPTRELVHIDRDADERVCVLDDATYSSRSSLDQNSRGTRKRRL